MKGQFKKIDIIFYGLAYLVKFGQSKNIFPKKMKWLFIQNIIIRYKEFV